MENIFAYFLLAVAIVVFLFALIATFGYILYLKDRSDLLQELRKNETK